MIFENMSLNFTEFSNGMFKATVSDGTTSKVIPLLIEKNEVELVEEKMRKVPLQKNTTLNLFYLIVAGCIRICRY